MAGNREGEDRGAINAAKRRHRSVPTAPQRRMFFSDVKPYEVPEKSDDLKGPASGVVHLPHRVLWAPGNGRIDLDAEGGVGLAYRAVLAEGTVEDQTAVVNWDRLVEVWPELLLPHRVRRLWEERFPELRAGASA
ncbi:MULTISPECIES: transcriptional regulator [Actinomyces]|uniref:Transcriptional regulator n=1 Tax=Actinomyces respiraculi TaxID=2744574 RepID=A0A7T0PVD8_9ACTO|nr:MULTISPECIES: transcriptional regulator [Actinomyces]QPL04599.1 transcriptional regulator [Actinomyces respiraculi]